MRRLSQRWQHHMQLYGGYKIFSWGRQTSCSADKRESGILENTENKRVTMERESLLKRAASPFWYFKKFCFPTPFLPQPCIYLFMAVYRAASRTRFFLEAHRAASPYIVVIIAFFGLRIQAEGFFGQRFKRFWAPKRNTGESVAWAAAVNIENTWFLRVKKYKKTS